MKVEGAELRKNVDLSDIPEIQDFSQGHLRNYKNKDFPPLTEEQKNMLDNLSKKTDAEIDTSDIAEAVGNGVFYYENKPKI